MKMQGDLALNVLSGRLLGYDLNNFQIRLAKNEQFLLMGHNTLSIVFGLWNIKASFSDGKIKVTESLIHTADWSRSIWGIITSAIAQDQQGEFTLQAQLRKSHSSEILCRDIQCFTNSLARPFTVSLSSQG
ncbi:hypothetical protein HNQ69_000597 [Bartonella callosciuri]|uniref:Uncharacterized protein n=1 Tax=Bartonella callosciuri TaxID=686223 RepID=A0A840NLF4_9HYPH|nr:hypothetical protein [Bartonella callosciuri]